MAAIPDGNRHSHRQTAPKMSETQICTPDDNDAPNELEARFRGGGGRLDLHRSNEATCSAWAWTVITDVSERRFDQLSS